MNIPDLNKCPGIRLEEMRKTKPNPNQGYRRRERGSSRALAEYKSEAKESLLRDDKTLYQPETRYRKSLCHFVWEKPRSYNEPIMYSMCIHVEPEENGVMDRNTVQRLILECLLSRLY